MTNRIRKTISRPHRLDDFEPALSDLIDDPVLRAIMTRDGIDCIDLVSAIDVARARLGLGPRAEAPCGPAAGPGSACCG